MESFELSLARLASRAKRAGIDSEFFWTLTVGEIHQIITEHLKELRAWDKAHDRRTAAMMALQANFHRRKNARPFRPDDFLAEDEDDFEACEPSEEERKQQFINFAKALGAQ